MIYFWSLIAAISAVGLESLFARTGIFWRFLPLIVPVQLVLSYGIYRTVVGSPSIIAATIIFATFTMMCRVGVSLYLGQSIGVGTWIGLGLMLLALFFRRTWA